MGPWPGIEPGLGEPQSPVLTPTPPQPSRIVGSYLVWYFNNPLLNHLVKMLSN